MVEKPRQRSHGERDRTEQESLTTDDITNVLKIEPEAASELEPAAEPPAEDLNTEKSR